MKKSIICLTIAALTITVLFSVTCFAFSPDNSGVNRMSTFERITDDDVVIGTYINSLGEINEKTFPRFSTRITAIGNPIEGGYQKVSFWGRNTHYAYGEKFYIHTDGLTDAKKQGLRIETIESLSLQELLKRQKKNGNTPELQKKFDDLMIESMAHLDKDVRTFESAIKIAALHLVIYDFCSSQIQDLTMGVTEISYIGAQRELQDIKKFGTPGAAREFLIKIKEKRRYLPAGKEDTFIKKVSDFIEAK